jgi:hypothetical protein
MHVTYGVFRRVLGILAVCVESRLLGRLPGMFALCYPEWESNISLIAQVISQVSVPDPIEGIKFAVLKSRSERRW